MIAMVISDGIQANIQGALVGFFMMLIHEPAVVLFCLGTVLTILLRRHLKIYRTVRSALVASVFITVPPYQELRKIIALERMVCVIIGCIIALLITLLFDYILAKIFAIIL